MGTTSSGAVTLTILKCLVVFYSSYYVVGSICFASFRLQKFDGKIPFDFHNWIDLGGCCGNLTSIEIVNTLSMEITFVVSGLLFGALTAHRLWDYAITVSVLHIALSCLVMLSFPLSWSWWVCLVLAAVQMIAFGEAVTYVRRKKLQGKISPAIELKEPQNYLYKKL
ncbi:putative transmembrane protein 244 [Liolophura sinensis]|uniref:putative transmembrane protein 244 n=1 Tax=Liolophura sinensis TaxID=3198878 RepID=UPI003159664E